MSTNTASAQVQTKILLQLMSSETRMADFIKALRTQVAEAARPGTTVDVVGTTSGVLADQYQLFVHYDTSPILENALSIRNERNYDAFAIGNTLDPGIVAMREILDVPVTTLMEAACHFACTLGETFAVMVPNPKFVHRYRQIIEGYGLGSRLREVAPLEFSNIPDFNKVFANPKAGEQAVESFIELATPVVARGSEVLLVAGPMQTLLAHHGVFEVGNTPILDGFSLLVNWTEMAVEQHRHSTHAVSRRGLYSAPSEQLMKDAADVYGVDALAPRTVQR